MNKYILQISSIFPMDGSEEIENPFLNQNELQEDN